MEKGKLAGAMTLGTITIVGNFILAAFNTLPFLGLFFIILRGFIPGISIILTNLCPFILAILGIICGINLLKLRRFQQILKIIIITVIYYALYAIYVFIKPEFEAPIVIRSIIVFLIWYLVLYFFLTRPKVKEQFK